MCFTALDELLVNFLACIFEGLSRANDAMNRFVSGVSDTVHSGSSPALSSTGTSGRNSRNSVCSASLAFCSYYYDDYYYYFIIHNFFLFSCLLQLSISRSSSTGLC